MISKNAVYLVQSYNGFSGSERLAKLREMHRVFPDRSHPYYRGPCDMCDDPTSPVMPHSEDYSKPYRWERPWMYAVCRTCHYRLHIRFRNSHAWTAYKLHLGRGGHGSDLRLPAIALEISSLAAELAIHRTFDLISLRRRSTNNAWWQHLTI
jgi:hypothetical protein